MMLPTTLSVTETKADMATETTPTERSNISAIVLHVEGADDENPLTLTFYKSESHNIVVGRKSNQGASEHHPERALFRCPVVSRKHAKITFTEFGNVYITDLHSHHGTHILRPGELVSASLKPEVPTVLADGDLITFGKSVGRDSMLVRPIVVRVELMFGGDAPMSATTPPPRSLEVDAAHGSSSFPSQSQQDKAFSRSNSGRYGVFVPSPTSSSSSDGDSDVQEISPPSSPTHVPILPCFSSIDSSLHSCNRLRLLQHFLPPISINLSPEPESPFVDPIVPLSLMDVAVEGGLFELASTRPPSPSGARSDNSVSEEPSVIGAWPGSPLPAPPLRPSEWCGEREVIEISDDDSASPEPTERAAVSIVESDPSHELRGGMEVEAMSVILEQVESLVGAQARQSQPEEHDVEVGNASVTFDLSAIEEQVADACTEINVLRAAHDKGEAIFVTHANQTRGRLDALDAQMRTTQASLTDRGAELSSVQARLQDLGKVISLMEEHNALAERVEELVKEVGSAKDLLQETCTLQRDAQAQMAQELEAVRALRAEAAAAIVEAKEATQAVSSSLNALKRKREDIDDEAAQVAPTELVASPTKRRRAVRVVSAIAQTATVATLGAVAAWSALAFS